MPVKVVRRRGKFRVVEASTNRIIRSSKGKIADGGGHRSRETPDRQARAINAAHSRKKKR